MKSAPRAHAPMSGLTLTLPYLRIRQPSCQTAPVSDSPRVRQRPWQTAGSLERSKTRRARPSHLRLSRRRSLRESQVARPGWVSDGTRRREPRLQSPAHGWQAGGNPARKRAGAGACPCTCCMARSRTGCCTARSRTGCVAERAGRACYIDAVRHGEAQRVEPVGRHRRRACRQGRVRASTLTARRLAATMR
jgi:hypothetical protein